MRMLQRCLPVLILFCPASTVGQPSVTRLHVTSRIQLRYASTQVLSHVTNPSLEAQEVKFEIRLPEKAFIHNFSMTVDGHEYVATVEEKEQAQQTYEDAREAYLGAGLVSRQSQDTSLFSIATNVPGNQEVVFKLQYDELLERDKDWYEHRVHLDLEDTVPDLRVEVIIDETLPLKAVEVPQLLMDNEINSVVRDLRQELEQKGDKTDWEKGLSHILFSPSTAMQEEARSLKVSGQFSVKYQVEMDPDGEVQVIDGYFVHFTEDEADLEPLPKYTVFVLDVSGSMSGEKIRQLQDSMFTVLDSMPSQDFFSIITFNYGVTVWTSNEVTPIDKSTDGPVDVMAATRDNLNVAIAFTNSLVASGGTNINDAMLRGLAMVEEKMKTLMSLQLLTSSSQPMVVFLTDGQATSGETSRSRIKANTQAANTLKLPLYCIAFGRDADFTLMKEISAESEAWSKMIYEGGDAAIQLENFYSQISSPVIKNLKFTYVGALESEAEVMNEAVKTVFKGSSYTHVGKIPEDVDIFKILLLGEKKDERIEKRFLICLRPRAQTCTQPSPRKPRSPAQGFMQKLHAFVHIRKLVERGNKAEEPGLQSDEQRALDLALKNNFVTSLTSLVVTTAQNTTTLASLSDEPGGVLESGGGGGYNRNIMMSAPMGGVMNSPTVMNSPVPSGGYSGRYYPRRRGGGGRGAPGGRGGWRGRGSSSRSSSRSSSIYSDDTDRSYQSPTMVTTTSTTTSTTTPASARCEGTITLWSSTYLRGESVQISTLDIEDLEDLGFDDKLVSLSVSACCWTLYSEPLFMGEEKRFRPGDYKGVSSVGKLFREASSVRQTPGRC